MTIVLGIVGAVIGGWIGVQLGLGDVHGFDLRSLMLAVAGSIIVLVGYRALATRRGGPPPS